MKKALCTGGSGFLGSYLVEQLLAKDYHVTVLDDFSRGRHIIPGATYIQADCADKNSAAFYHKQKVDVVFNLAADVGGVFYNIAKGPLIYAANARLQALPLAYAQAARVPAFVQVSSVCVYDYYDNAIHTEGEPLYGQPFAGNLGYALAKRGGESIATAANFAQLIIARPTNMAGARDHYDELAHVIPALVKKAVHSKDGTLEVLSPPEVKRQFIHPSQTAAALIALYEGGHSGTYNIADTAAVTMGELAQYVADAINRRAIRLRINEIKYKPQAGLRYEMNRALDAAKIHATIGPAWPTRSWSVSEIVADSLNYYLKTILED